MTTAIYAGSFDILTRGHINIIQKMAYMFSSSHILVSNNPEKKYIFSAYERLKMIEAYKKDSHFPFHCAIWDYLTIDYMKTEPNRILVRGIRNTADILDEMKLADVNRELSGIETVFIPCSNSTRNVSSSLVKELWKYGRDISPFVPAYVEEMMKGVPR